MNYQGQDAGLVHALRLSQQITDAAERGDVPALSALDVQRTKLIHSFRRATRIVNDADRALLRQITDLNNRAIGMLEHHQRSKGRELDMAAVGRRAVAAYAQVRGR